MTLEGSYQNLRRFIREIETSNQFVVVSAVELEPSENNEKENQTPNGATQTSAPTVTRRQRVNLIARTTISARERALVSRVNRSKSLPDRSNRRTKEKRTAKPSVCALKWRLISAVRILCRAPSKRSSSKFHVQSRSEGNFYQENRT
jgi:hypothetical protein